MVNGMSTSFPYIEVPANLETVFGKRDGGSRVYRKEGPQEETAAWLDALMQAFGPCVSPGGVSMYCPVSRAAVHKRIKEGRLTLFLYHVTHRKTFLFGKKITIRESPYGYIPVCEAKAWREELEHKAVEQGIITRGELEGAKPDWHGDFVDWNSAWTKEQARKAKEGNR